MIRRMTAAEYRVELDLFCGPLDLLLYLVRRNEVDILDLPISKITAQFVEFLEILEFIDLDFIGDFVVMASTLVEIKSRFVLPSAEEEPEPELDDDPRSELIQQLLEYKKFKDAARALEERAAQWQERYPRLSDERPRQGRDPSVDRIKDVELWDLVSALGRVLRRKVVEEEARIRYDDTPISVYVGQISERVRREKRVAFTSLFDDATHRSKIVGLFLALLELLRRHSFRADQPVAFGEIWILPPMDNAAEHAVVGHDGADATGSSAGDAVDAIRQ